MSQLVVFDDGMKGIDTKYANITTEGNLSVTELELAGNIRLDNSDGKAVWSLGLDNSDSDSFKITKASKGGIGFMLHNYNQSSCIIPDKHGNDCSPYWPADWFGGLATFDIVCSAISAHGYVTRSDDMLKNNEQLIINAIPTIMKLTPQSYLKKPSVDSSNIDEWTEEFGLIAQEVYYDAPELRRIVTLGQGTNPIDLVEPRSSNLQEDPDYTSLGWSSENPSGLNYTGLIPWLIRGIQEQQNKITELETIKEELQTLKSFLQNKYPGEL